MVVIILYNKKQKFEDSIDNFEDFTAVIGATLDMEDDAHSYTYEYTLDDKTFFLLNKENYMQFYNESSKATVYVYSSKEETHYYKEKQKLN